MKRDKNDLINPDDFRSSLADLGAIQNFSDADSFLETFILCATFCQKNKKIWDQFRLEYIEESRRGEIAEHNANNNRTSIAILKEIYSSLDPFSQEIEGFIADILFCKHIDYLLEYIKDILSIVTLSNVEASNLKKEFTVRELLNHSNSFELIETIMQDEIQKISHGEKRDIKKLLKEFKLDSVHTSKENEMLEFYIKLRNSIVHQRGIRNLYKAKSDKTKKRGHPRKIEVLNFKKLEQARAFIDRYIRKLDKAAMRSHDLSIGHKLILKKI